MALPSEPYEYSEWRVRRVGVDHHVDIDAHYYSVPYRFARAEVEARLTACGVEIFQKGERIAVHLRASGNRKHTTVPEHMPSSHRRYAGWTIERIREDARKIGPATAAALRANPGRQATSRAGLPRLSRHRASRRLLSAPRASRPLPSAPSRSAPDLWLGQIHPRYELDRRPAPGRPADTAPIPSSQHPRAALLPGRRQRAQASNPRSASHPRPLWNGRRKRRPRRRPGRGPGPTPIGSPCGSTGRPHGGGTNASRPGCAADCVSRRASKMSIIAPPRGLDPALF